MKSRRFKGVLAVMLVIVLMLSLVPLETVTPAAMQDKAKTNDSPIESETISEICSQKEVVNNAKPAPADGYIVKLKVLISQPCRFSLSASRSAFAQAIRKVS